MSTHPQIVDFEYVPLEKAKEILGKSEKTIQRYVTAGELRTKLEPREGRKPERVYHAGDLQRIQEQAIASHAPESTALAVRTLPTQMVTLRDAMSEPAEAMRELASSIVYQAELREQEFERVPLKEKLWLSLAEAEEYSGISQSNLRELLEVSQIHALRLGPHRAWRIYRKSLEAFGG